jgi:Domain of unknown function (DUF4124)
MKSPVRIFMALAILLATATVTAQVYKWIDKDGRVQYTDTPPPASATKTEAKKLAAPPSPTAGSTSSAASAAAAPAKSLQERSKEFDKRRTETAEKAKKDEETEKVAKQNQERCKEANRYLSSLESGAPLVRNNDKGERTIMTDAERASETARAKAAATESCKG